MTSFEAMATTLAVEVHCLPVGPDDYALKLLGVNIVVANDEGRVIDERWIYPLGSKLNDHPAELQSVNVERDFQTIIETYFAGGHVNTLLATNMSYLLGYFGKRHAPKLAKCFAEATRIDIETLVAVLPDSLLMNGISSNLNPDDMLKVYSIFKGARVDPQNALTLAYS